MTIPTGLLTDFVARYPAQPATAFFRSIEIAVLARAMRGHTDGIGLDLGCGDGILTDILFQEIGERPDLIGIDIDPLETEAAAAYSFYRRIHTAPAQAIPEPDANIDYVVSNSVLEHIPDLNGVIAEVGRVLRPGGRFFFTVPSAEFRDNLSVDLKGQARSRYLEKLDRRLAHFHYLSASDWHEMCGRHGLTVETTDGYLDYPETRRWETLSNMTGGLLHTLAGGKDRPIELQRKLKVRQLQNTMRIPRPIASAVANVVKMNMAEHSVTNRQSCLLVTGRR
ncbi:class I SAM-dependent methyltransferase [Sphingomonas sp. PB2P19]|uniref:class I SAM-dependent methyltransferase n=1 Tax=Sphingomonas rhamnosi TaxID=3096156 RepID=UPI002FC742D6